MEVVDLRGRQALHRARVHPSLNRAAQSLPRPDLAAASLLLLPASRTCRCHGRAAAACGHEAQRGGPEGAATKGADGRSAAARKGAATKAERAADRTKNEAVPDEP